MVALINPDDAVRIAWERGWFFNPAFQDGLNVQYLDALKIQPDEPIAQQAFWTGSDLQASEYTPLVKKHHQRLIPKSDGVLGPAMLEMMSLDRCHVPDFPAPAGIVIDQQPNLSRREVMRSLRDSVGFAGVGNWRGCPPATTDFHSCAVRVNTSGIGSHLKPVFGRVLQNVQNSFAFFGNLFRFYENGKDILTGDQYDGRYNIEFSFVSRSNGWIGLAIIGTGQTCASNIWCRFLASYRGSDVVREWTTLIKHELIHNCGKGHTSGGVMNPSIVRGLPTLITSSDPVYSWLRNSFGGIPYPVDPTGPDPPKPSIDERVTLLEGELTDIRGKQIATDAIVAQLLRERSR